MATVAENRWIKQTPTPRQSEFLLQADAAESLFGGAAGGGKSSALLMAALQFVEVPKYAAIIFRRTYSDLALPGALMSRAAEWLSGTGAKWTDLTKTWTFPSGASLTFGYLDNASDRFRYQSSEFQFAGFDELTQFKEEDYLYIFSRLRRLKGSEVPVRMRAASNPGGNGAAWVKKRWGIKPESSRESIWRHDGRLFIPSKLDDNPHLDADEYRRALENLDPFTRRQLLNGDWSEFQGNHFYPSEWPRFRFDGGAYTLQPRRILLDRDVWRFSVVDPATEAKRKADHTAIMTLGVTPTTDLLILDVVRRQIDVGQVIPTLAEVCRAWSPSFVGLESVAFQKLLVQQASVHRDIPPVRELKPHGKGKLARAVAAIVLAERKQIFLPESAAWLDDFVAEVASFTGNDAEDDQVDCLAYGALSASKFARGTSGQGPAVLTPGKDFGIFTGREFMNPAFQAFAPPPSRN